MASGFTTVKDVLEVIAVPVALALLAALWPAVEGYYRRRRFQRLARRELAELAPYPNDTSLGSWTKHVRTGLVHRAIVDAPSENRDFLLSLNPSFTYYISQLWAAHKNGDTVQWLHYLDKLSTWGYSGTYRTRIEKVNGQWHELIKAYGGLQ